MQLDVGNAEQIDDPSPSQIEHQLRNLPAGAPFAILSGDDELYIQVLAADDAYRVELRQGGRHRYVVVSLDGAIALFQAFSRWDEPAVNAADWRPLRWFRRLQTLTAFLVLVAIMVALSLWTTLR